MLECRRTMGQIVIPIFFDVQPSEVPSQFGIYLESFQMHKEKGVEPHILDNLWEALQEIGSLKGHIVYGRNEAQVVEEIISNVRDLLMVGEKERKDENLQKSGSEEELLFRSDEVLVPEYLVGVDERVNAIIEELQIFSSNMQIVEIWGIPGIGKTTLAKLVYNKLCHHFQAYGFVSDIRKRAAAEGLFSLQKQLILQLMGKNFEWLNSFSFRDNINFIGYGFWDRRVLIVLDDVDCLDHLKAFAVDLHCFGPGSRIILTTQKPKLLDEQAKVTRKYEVKALDDDQAFLLFCQRAFGRDFPDEEYYDLSIQIASLTRGIPSVIESIGSDLCHKSRDMWEEVLQVLSKCEQPASLATECFLTGESKTIAHYDVVLCFNAQDRVNDLIEGLYNRMKSFGIGILALDGDFMRLNLLI